MTYLTTAFSENAIVMGSDGRAHYFDDWKEKGQVIGKIITSYCDGHKKTFLLKNRVGISAQGVLFWGNGRKLLALHLRDFERSLRSTEPIAAVSEQLLRWFRTTKRKGSHEFEVMHFLVGGLEGGIPHVYYVNTFGQGSLTNVCPEKMKRGLINGDGQTEEIFKVNLSTKNLIQFVKREIVRVHYLKPFDVGDTFDILVIPQRGRPYWHRRQELYHGYPTYDRYMRAIQNGSLRTEKLSPPNKLRYRLTKANE